MKKITVFNFCLFVCFLIFMNSAYAESHYRYIHDVKKDVYFGHISYTEEHMEGEMPVVLREGQSIPEMAVLNFPIAPGDTVITPKNRRCEIQFDTGTIIRLDANTEIKVETILAQSLTSVFKLTNLILNKGQIYVMYKQYSSAEILQILLSNASAKLKHNTVLMMRANPDGSSNIKVDTGQASVLFGPEGMDLDKTILKRFDEATISAQNKIMFSPYTGDVDFSLWNKDMNKNFLALHEGISVLPKPIQRLSLAVFNFAQKFSNIYGEWLWNDIYGYVWRPFTNDSYPSGNWSPYQFGQWRKINQDLFWVPEEKWGWAPYHLGVWVWDKKTGWLWIPGGAFAPSWASWNVYMGYFSWRPITLFDWLFQGFVYSYVPQNVYENVFERGYTNDYYDATPYTGNQIDKSALNKINAKQLKRNSSVRISPPKRIRKVLADVSRAVQKGDEGILASFKDMPQGTLVVYKDHLSNASIQEWKLDLDQMPAAIQGGLAVRSPYVDPIGFARIAFRRNNFIARLAENVKTTPSVFSVAPASKESWLQSLMGKSAESAESILYDPYSEKEGSGSSVERSGLRSNLQQSARRTRDWNPDTRAAGRLGTTVRYSSLENAVRVPGLDRGSYRARSGSFDPFRTESPRRSSTTTTVGASSSSSSGRTRSSSTSSSSSSSSSSSKSTTVSKIKKN